MENYEIISDRQEKVLRYLVEHGIPFTTYNHPEGKTIEEAKRWWHDDGSVHCKNIFMRNHKGNQHYLICFPCEYDLAIHDIEHWLKDVLVSQGLNAPGKLSFASPDDAVPRTRTWQRQSVWAHQRLGAPCDPVPRQSPQGCRIAQFSPQRLPRNSRHLAGRFSAVPRLCRQQSRIHPDYVKFDI